MPVGNGNSDIDSAESPEEATALTPRQATAALELSRGKSVTETARAAGVSRQTLYLWMREPEFIAWLKSLAVGGARKRAEPAHGGRQ